MSAARLAGIALWAALALGGCSNGTRPPILVDDGGCVAQCGKCAPLATCVAAPYQPACLQACVTTADCVPGHVCGQLTPSSDADGVCLSVSALFWCHKQDCDIHAQCRDAQTLLRPLPYLDKICGWELVRCDSGCDSTTAQCK